MIPKIVMASLESRRPVKFLANHRGDRCAIAAQVRLERGHGRRFPTGSLVVNRKDGAASTRFLLRFASLTSGLEGSRKKTGSDTCRASCASLCRCDNPCTMSSGESRWDCADDRVPVARQYENSAAGITGRQVAAAGLHASPISGARLASASTASSRRQLLHCDRRSRSGTFEDNRP